MLFNLNGQFKLQIPSFESIQFRLSQNYISSRTQTIQQQINSYNPISLTYTQSCADMNSNSITCIQYHDDERNSKQNYNNMRGILAKRPDMLKFRWFKKFSNKVMQIKKANETKNNKSILCVQNIQLHTNSSIDEFLDVSQKNQKSIKIQKRFSCGRNRVFSQNSSKVSYNKKNETKRIHTQESMSPSHFVKRSFSLRTNDLSNSSSFGKSVQKSSLRKSEPSPNNGSSLTRVRRAVTDIIFNKKIVDKVDQNFSSHLIIGKMRKKHYLNDTVPLCEVMNIKAIKLEQNRAQSKLYLRKIIQNRVNTQHYDEDVKNSKNAQYNRRK